MFQHYTKWSDNTDHDISCILRLHSFTFNVIQNTVIIDLLHYFILFVNTGK